MKYRVTGQNRETGARQIMEFEADSKGAAERKAEKAGMTVNHAAVVEDATPPVAETPTPATGGGLLSKAGWAFILIVLIAVIVFLKWERLKRLWDD